MTVDFLVIGQGIAGTTLTARLLENGCSVKVIDMARKGASSAVAAGLFNPLSGRKAELTWLYAEFWDQIKTFYPAWQQKLGVEFFFLMPLFRPFETANDQNNAMSQSQNWPEFYEGIEHNLSQMVHAPFGGLKVRGSGYVDWPIFLTAFRNYLLDKQSLIEDLFVADQLKISSNQIGYQQIKAKGIVLCQGHFALENELFSNLPFRPAKGEILDLHFEQPIPCIFNKNGWVLPHHSGICRAGATFSQSLNTEISPEAVAEIEAKVTKLMKIKFKTLEAKTGIRPATAKRKPFLGKHQKHNNVFIFNGLGSRGTAIAPLASTWMCDFMLHQKPLPEGIDLKDYFPN
jgi:glycine/D-amino acid oxidase-like deaminating enzyme